MTDRELLELAAYAAGLDINKERQAERDRLIDPETAGLWLSNGQTWWNPLDDDGDALRLAVKLGFCLFTHATEVGYSDGHGGVNIVAGQKFRDCAATRRAIVRATAEIGRQMKEK